MEMIRRDVTLKEMLMYVEMLEGLIENRIAKHGPGLHISAHETFGLLAEEQAELLDAIHQGDDLAVINELGDIATAALFGMVSASRRITIPPVQEAH